MDEQKIQGTYKNERIITSPQHSTITTQGSSVLNFCSNNYLGLAHHPSVWLIKKRLKIKQNGQLIISDMDCQVSDLFVEHNQFTNN